MRALSRVLALLLLVSGLASAQGVPGALAPCKMDGSDCAPATGTVTTTGTLASGQVALGSGATSITGDAGLTYSGTGTTFKLGIGTDVFLSRASAGTLLVEDGSGNARDVQARTGTFGTSVVTPLVSGGADSATPNATVVTGTGSRGGTDTNVAGGNLTIRPGAGTGSATGSSIVLQTPTAGASGATGQTQTTRLSIAESGTSFTAGTFGITASGLITIVGNSGSGLYFLNNNIWGPNGVLKLGVPTAGWGGFYLDYTNTATVGAVTIDKPSGRVILAIGATSVVVTNSLVTAASHVFVTRRTNDATALFSYLTSAAGSFTIFATAAATADTEFDFFVAGAD